MTNFTLHGPHETRTIRALDVFSQYITYGEDPALTEKETAQVKKAVKHIGDIYYGSVITVGGDINSYGRCDITGARGRTVDWTIINPKILNPNE